MTFTLRIEHDDGSVVDVPVDFDFKAMTYDQMAWVSRRLAEDERMGADPILLSAACIFAKSGLPEADWGAVRPVLVDLIDPEGSTDNLVIEA